MHIALIKRLTDTTKGSDLSKIPDITNSMQAEYAAPLDAAGMAGIEVPVVVPGFQHQVLTKVDATVDIRDPKTKGIHMSRLYLILLEQIAQKELNRERIETTLREFLRSHQDISENAYMKLEFELPLLRPALLSSYSGWRFYPVEMRASLDTSNNLTLAGKCEIMYSSTCPCSAALARQMIQDKFAEDFKGQASVEFEAVREWLGKEESILATPHGQRSRATISVEWRDGSEPEWLAIIAGAEETLKTPVQTVVKREDEQEFARLNGANLMFAEDASRRLHQFLSGISELRSFHVDVAHFESLHAHDAIARARKQD